MAEQKSVWISIHHKLVRKDIPYTDKETGEEKTFNSVTLPKGVTVGGKDLSYFEFSPLYLYPSKFRGKDFVDIPLVADKLVWLKKTELDEQRKPVIGEDGKPVKKTYKVMPETLKQALLKSYSDYKKSAPKADESDEEELEETPFADEDILF